jgi:succinate dehydrogenase cytochrome b subunit
MNKPLKYAYFPGCVTKQISTEYDVSTRLACEKLGIELVDIPEFSCCGAGVLKEANKSLNTSLNARNFALSERQNLDMMTICSTCVNNLNKDLFELRENPDTLEANNKKLIDFDLNCSAKLNVKHLLWILEHDYGYENIKKLVTKPLKGLKIATYYGCHILRPSNIVPEYQNSENPQNFEEFVRILGGQPVDIKEKSDCCGFHITLINPKASAKMSGNYLDIAKQHGADMVVTNCPFCHMQMDMYQSKSEKELKIKLKVPVIHFTQLLCIALGIDPKKLGFKRHFISSSFG